jgi:hypothetical protein
VLAFSKRLSDNYFTKHAADLQEIQSMGIPVRTSFSEKGLKSFGERIQDAVTSGKNRNKFSAALGEAWNVAINDPTFSRMIPIMQTDFYRHVRDNLIRVGVNRDEAMRIAGDRLINFEGINRMSKNAAKSKVGQDALTTFIFAPKYRETMINFWGRNVKALYPKNIVKALNPTDGSYRNNLIFNAGALLTFIAMDDLNQRYNNGRHLWDNPSGKQDKALIPLGDGTVVGIPFLSSIATIPRLGISVANDVRKGDSEQLWKDIKGIGSYAYKPILDIATNQDYFGNPVRNTEASFGEQAKQAGKYLFSQYQHPYIRAALNMTNPEDNQKKTYLPGSFRSAGVTIQVLQGKLNIGRIL